MDDFDDEIREFGDDPDKYNQDEKGEIWEDLKITEEMVVQFLTYFYPSVAQVKKLLKDRDYENILSTVVEECSRPKITQAEKEEIRNHIRAFRSRANNYLADIGHIGEGAAKRNHEESQFTTDTDEMFPPGSRAWLLNKIFFDVCNKAMNIVDPL